MSRAKRARRSLEVAQRVDLDCVAGPLQAARLDECRVQVDVVRHDEGAKQRDGLRGSGKRGNVGSDSKP